ncbi:MAG TPA: hypothetical protein VME23_13335 [Terracidiphilus sp.]|nr:hypothetical protein [Terracidiphilus sp.]
MNFISNIWNHPRTSAAGVLIAVVTIAGVLSQQGISLGKAGSGTVISLVTAIATAMLGLLARDPEQGSGLRSQGSGSTQKLAAWMLISLLLLSTMTGCSAASVAQDIVNWTPALESAVATVDSTGALLAPADAPVFTAATQGFDAAANLLNTQAKAYLANPSASVLAQLQTQVVTFQQQVNSSLLAVTRIMDPASQKHALSAVQAVATIVNAMLALVESVSSKAAVAHMAQAAQVKIAAVEPLLDREAAAAVVAAHYGEPTSVARGQVWQTERVEIQAGF